MNYRIDIRDEFIYSSNSRFHPFHAYCMKTYGCKMYKELSKMIKVGFQDDGLGWDLTTYFITNRVNLEVE